MRYTQIVRDLKANVGWKMNKTSRQEFYPFLGYMELQYQVTQSPPPASEFWSWERTQAPRPNNHFAKHQSEREWEEIYNVERRDMGVILFSQSP